MIWDFAIVPRLVGFTPCKIPGIFHVNRESRRQSKYSFQIRDFNATGILAQPKADILHLDQSSFSPRLNYHSTAIHTISCGGIQTSMTRDIERVAFSVRELNAIFRIECIHCFLKCRLRTRFPSLKELIVILRQGPAGATAEDLYEVKSGNGHDYLQGWIDDMTAAFNLLQAQGCSLGTKLTFMRLEKWEDLQRNN
jgi:hypothetical protein